MEKTLTSIYLDPSQPASLGGLDTVYRAVKEKVARVQPPLPSKPIFLRGGAAVQQAKRKERTRYRVNKSEIGWVSKMFIHFTTPGKDATREVESSFLE